MSEMPITEPFLHDLHEALHHLQGHVHRLALRKQLAEERLAKALTTIEALLPHARRGRPADRHEPLCEQPACVVCGPTRDYLATLAAAEKLLQPST